MKTVKIPSKVIEVKYETDVLVVGGGTAGVGAAIGAARSGARTMLIEQRNCLGGYATGGLVSCFMNRDFNVHSGFYEEVAMDLKRAGKVQENVHCAFSFDRESMKFLLENKVKEAGIDLLYYTRCIDVIMEDNTIKGVIIDSVAGHQAILAKIVIDCTRVGSVAKLAGAEMIVTRQEDRSGFLDYCVIKNVDLGEVMVLQNENSDDYISDPNPHMIVPYGHGGVKFWPVELIGGHKDIEAARARGEFTFDKNEVYIYNMVDYGMNTMKLMCWVYNTETAYDDAKDQYDLKKITQADLNMKEQIWALVEHMKKNVRGFKAAYLDQTHNELGYFVTRMKGDYVMTDEECFDGAIYDDSIAIASWYKDTPASRLCDCELHDIPYRCLYSKNIENLMGAGFNISSGDVASYTVFDQPTCFTTGQAAGIAAAYAVKCGVTARNVDVKEVQKLELAQGMKVGISYLPKAVVDEYKDAVIDMRMRRARGDKDGRIF